MSGLVIWFIIVLGAGVCSALIALFLMKRSTRASEENVDSEAGPHRVTVWLMVARLGLAFSIAGLLVAIFLIPIANYLPEDIALPAFIYSLLAFPLLVVVGVVLSLLSYVSKRYQSSLAGMIVSGLSVVWLVASYLIRVSAFDR